MDSVGAIFFLYFVGVMLIAAELLLPSHGMLTIAALVCFGVAVYHTFGQNQTLGIVAALGCIVFVPAALLLGIKYVAYLPFGDHFAPPNPTQAQIGDAFDNDDDSAELVGQSGKAITPLRPVGICDFSGRRIQCVSESGVIDPGQIVRGVGVQMNTLEVRPEDSRSA